MQHVILAFGVPTVGPPKTQSMVKLAWCYVIIFEKEWQFDVVTAFLIVYWLAHMYMMFDSLFIK